MSKTLPTTSTKSANVRAFDQADAQQVVEHILTTATRISLDLSGSVEDWQQDAVADENRAAALDARRGLRFMAIKQSLGHGEFVQWVEQAGFNKRRAQEAMQIATLLLHTQENTAAKLIGLDKSKLTTLAKLPIETIEDAEAKGELDEIDEMSVRELKAHVRKLQVQNDNLATEKITISNKLKAANERAIKALPITEFPEFVTILRQESHALSEKALLCLDSLEQRLNEHVTLLQSSDGKTTKGFQQAADIASHTLYLQARNIAARAAALTERIHADLMLDATQGIKAEALFNTEEITAAVKDRELLVQEHKHEEALRELQRDMAKPRGAGRPTGSKTNTKKNKK